MKLIMSYNIQYILGCYFKRTIEFQEYLNPITLVEAVFYRIISNGLGIDVRLPIKKRVEYDILDCRTLDAVTSECIDTSDYVSLTHMFKHVTTILDIEYKSYNTFEVRYR